MPIKVFSLRCSWDISGKQTGDHSNPHFEHEHKINHSIFCFVIVGFVPLLSRGAGAATSYVTFDQVLPFGVPSYLHAGVSVSPEYQRSGSVPAQSWLTASALGHGRPAVHDRIESHICSKCWKFYLIFFTFLASVRSSTRSCSPWANSNMACRKRERF